MISLAAVALISQTTIAHPCGDVSPEGVVCELPVNHRPPLVAGPDLGDHLGRNYEGRWHSWPRERTSDG